MVTVRFSFLVSTWLPKTLTSPNPGRRYARPPEYSQDSKSDPCSNASLFLPVEWLTSPVGAKPTVRPQVAWKVVDSVFSILRVATSARACAGARLRAKPWSRAPSQGPPCRLNPPCRLEREVL